MCLKCVFNCLTMSVFILFGAQELSIAHGSGESGVKKIKQKQSEKKFKDKLTPEQIENTIIINLEDESGIPIESHPLNTEGESTEEYDIDGHIFARQDVSGTGLSCLFNAMGVNRIKQVTLLWKNRFDSVVRYMCADDMVQGLSIVNESDIPQSVKNEIDFENYKKQRDYLAEVESEIRPQIAQMRAIEYAKRNNFCAQQTKWFTENWSNVSGEKKEVIEEYVSRQSFPGTLAAWIKKNWETLAKFEVRYPEDFSTDTLQKNQNKLLEGIRKKARSLKAFYWWLKDSISQGDMMQISPGNDYTTADAIAYINKFGIKVYNDGEELLLAHKYIPEGAKYIVYVYRSGIHFQALVPVSQKE